MGSKTDFWTTSPFPIVSRSARNNKTALMIVKLCIAESKAQVTVTIGRNNTTSSWKGSLYVQPLKNDRYHLKKLYKFYHYTQKPSETSLTVRKGSHNTPNKQEPPQKSLHDAIAEHQNLQLCATRQKACGVDQHTKKLEILKKISFVQHSWFDGNHLSLKWSVPYHREGDGKVIPDPFLRRRLMTSLIFRS